MIEVPTRKRVLIVGAGRRVQNNFLPAFRCLDDRFEVRGLHSRTPARLLAVARRWCVPAVENLADFDFSGIDLVAISVPTAQNAAVVKSMLPFAERLHLLIDTPIAWNREELDEVYPLLIRFAGVSVAEDYMNFPAFQLVRDAVIAGIIGRPRSLSLFHIGYLYHGLALIRSFVGFSSATKSWCKPLGICGAIVGYDFADGFVATVVGPYRRHEFGGGLLLEGTTGIITESPSEAEDRRGDKEIFLLQAVRDAGVLTGYKLVGDNYVMQIELCHLKRMSNLDFADKSEINLMRGCGLINILQSIFHTRNINANYTYRNALYDSFASQRANQGQTELDPFGLLPRPEMTRWRAKTETFIKVQPGPSADMASFQKIAVKDGDMVTASGGGLANGHLTVVAADLNGEPLPKCNWYLFGMHWQQVTDGL